MIKQLSFLRTGKIEKFSKTAAIFKTRPRHYFNIAARKAVNILSV